ncbi:hypothetical protein ACSVC9_00860 [Clostridium sp. LBM24168]
MLKKSIKTLCVLTILASLNVNAAEVHAMSYRNISTISQTSLKGNHKSHWKLRLEKLVEAGTINEKQKDAVLNSINSGDFRKSMKKNPECFRNKLDSLVQNKTITEKQKTAIEQLLDSSKKQGKNFKASFNNGLDELVGKKIITKAQKSAIENISASCRKEHRKQLATFLNNKLDALVKNNTITQVQKKAIVKSLVDFKH